MTKQNGSEPAVRTSREGGILTIELNRPEARNAVNAALAVGIQSAIDELESDDDLKAAVITGNGGCFCAGFDLKAYLEGENPITERGFGGIVRTPPEKPIIAAVEGFAIAGGMEIMLSCDLVVAANDAKFGIPEAKRGLVAAAGALIRLPKRVPYQAAMYLALTGELIDANEADKLGLITKLCEPGDAFATAMSIAKIINDNAPLSVRVSKAIVKGAVDVDETAGWELQDRLGLTILDTEDAKEGAKAFAERREPVWKGR